MKKYMVYSYHWGKKFPNGIITDAPPAEDIDFDIVLRSRLFIGAFNSQPVGLLGAGEESDYPHLEKRISNIRPWWYVVEQGKPVN